MWEGPPRDVLASPEPGMYGPYIRAVWGSVKMRSVIGWRALLVLVLLLVVFGLDVAGERLFFSLL